MATAPDLNLGEIREHQLSQYINSTKINALLKGIADLWQARVANHLEEIDRISNIKDRSGFYLDFVGIRLGIVRPRIEDPNLVYFGLDGTSAEGGRPLAQAPFWTADRSTANYQAIGDHTFRCVIWARARKLHGDVGKKAWRECLKLLSQNGGGASIIPVADFQVKIQYHDLAGDLLAVMQDPVFAPKIMPMIPGVKYSWEETFSTLPVSFTTSVNRPVVP